MPEGWSILLLIYTITLYADKSESAQATPFHQVRSHRQAIQGGIHLQQNGKTQDNQSQQSRVRCGEVVGRTAADTMKTRSRERRAGNLFLRI